MSEVISIRVKKHVKRLMKLVNINWREEIEKFIERKAKEVLREKILDDSLKLLKKMKKIDNYKLIREDRDER